MNYDRIILELLDRVKTLEEKVNMLQGQSIQQNQPVLNETDDTPAPQEPLVSTQQVLEFISKKKQEAQTIGLDTVTLKAGDIAKELGAVNRIVIIINAMKQAMGEFDRIISNVNNNSILFEVCYNLKEKVEVKSMKGMVNTFEIKRGISPQTELAIKELKVYKGEEYILVYDNKGRCVGVVFEHFERRGSPANGQAEICFFDNYYNEFGKWHRMFIGGYQGGERIKYSNFETQIAEHGSYKYSGYIKP